MRSVRAGRRVFVRASVAASLALGCAGAPLAPADPETPVQLQERQIIVAIPLVTPAVRTEQARRLASQYDLELIGAFPLGSIDVYCTVFEVPAGRDVADATRELATHPGVRLVQANQTFQSMATAHTDPYASFQHGAERLRAGSAHRWATGKGVRVALVDTGVDIDHPDLAGRVVETRNFVQGGEEHFTRDAHGTGVAGVIAARADNDEGIYGIAPDAELVVAKACWQLAAHDDSALCSSWTLARAIDYSIASGVRVLNLSLAGPEDPLLTRLLGAADEAGVVIAAAAGEGGAPRFPASLDFVIAVVASDEEGAVPDRVWESGVSALAAPGVEIITTAPGARYRFVSGSSLSTAHVSGAAALLLERDPELSAAAVADLLASTARTEADPGAAPIGGVDVCAAIRRLSGGEHCP